MYLLKEFYKLGIVTCPVSESIQEMKEACDYLMIPFDEKTIKTNNLGESLSFSPVVDPRFVIGGSMCTKFLRPCPQFVDHTQVVKRVEK